LKTETYTDSPAGPGLGKATIYTITILAVLLIGYIMVRAMRSYVASTPVNTKRAAERTAARKDVEAAGKAELNGPYVIINKDNAVVRLPIERAMELTIQGYQNPAAFRSNILSRVENATKPPKPVSYE
jgi:hypothetical protein